MKIGDIQSIRLYQPEQIQKPVKENEKGSFGDMFNGFVADVNKMQLDSNQKLNDFVEGKDVELHEVMIAGQKAKTSLNLLMEIRNKTIDMYREITRMQ
jgi:flagellar hook-basal body complex protein FliE